MHGALDPGGYKDVILFLATAAIVAPLFQRLKLSPILGLLLAGVALGPHGLGQLATIAPWTAYVSVERPAEIAELAQLGVVFLMFMVGLELSWERLRLLRAQVFGLGAAQIVVSAAAIGLIAFAIGVPAPVAAVIGLGLALSSTALTLPALSEQRRLASGAGRAAFAVLLAQDLAVAPILVALSVIAGGAEADFPGLALAFAPALIGVALLVAVGRLGLRPLMKAVARAKSSEAFTAACLLVIIGAGLASALFGLSMALGAFIAGVLLAETEFRHEVEVLIDPFKGLLLGLFFLSLGIGLDVPQLLAHPLTVVGLVAALIAAKGAVMFALARIGRLKTRAALEAALALSAAGEFAFVILAQAAQGGLVPPAAASTVGLVAGLSMFATPFLTNLGARLARPEAPREAAASALPAGGAAAGVLVVGFGRVGRLVAEMLERHQIAWLAVERDARLVEAGRREGKPVFFGDASRTDLLSSLGLASARALVVTMDAPDTAEAVTAAARALRADLTIVVRARDARHARRLYDLGATDAVPETVEASLQLSEATLVDIGVPMGLVIASIHERRDEYRRDLNQPKALGGRRRQR
ncbi:MAG TPA: cation:proton antiporter [Caulobacteraceae bacterium]|nr:cation:proton antiporter [Caulobacteraceae bacterium]